MEQNYLPQSKLTSESNQTVNKDQNICPHAWVAFVKRFCLKKKYSTLYTNGHNMSYNQPILWVDYMYVYMLFSPNLDKHILKCISHNALVRAYFISDLT